MSDITDRTGGIEFPQPSPADILCGPWGVKHRGEFDDPNYECDEPECGCHE